MKQKSLLQFLQSDTYAFISFVTMVTPLMFHTASLIIEVSGFSFSSKWVEYLYSTLFAVGFDLAILNFALNGREKEASGLAFIVFALNLSFFNLDFFFSIGNVQSPAAQWITKLIVSGVISGTGAWIIHRYVSFFKERADGTSKLELAQADIQQHKENLKELEEQISALSGQVKSKINECMSLRSLMEKERSEKDSAAQKHNTNFLLLDRTYKGEIASLNYTINNLKAKNSELEGELQEEQKVTGQNIHKDHNGYTSHKNGHSANYRNNDSIISVRPEMSATVKEEHQDAQITEDTILVKEAEKKPVKVCTTCGHECLTVQAVSAKKRWCDDKDCGLK